MNSAIRAGSVVPHDYVCFEKELEPLIANIHGETVHKGKKPKHGAGGTQRRTELNSHAPRDERGHRKRELQHRQNVRDEIKRVEEIKE